MAEVDVDQIGTTGEAEPGTTTAPDTTDEPDTTAEPSTTNAPDESAEPETTDEPQQYYYGDVNLDGEVNVSDALAILKHYVRLEEITGEIPLVLADTNQDSFIDVADALDALKVYVGLQEAEICSL